MAIWPWGCWGCGSSHPIASWHFASRKMLLQICSAWQARLWADMTCSPVRVWACNHTMARRCLMYMHICAHKHIYIYIYIYIYNIHIHDIYDLYVRDCEGIVSRALRWSKSIASLLQRLLCLHTFDINLLKHSNLIPCPILIHFGDIGHHEHQKW